MNRVLEWPAISVVGLVALLILAVIIGNALYGPDEELDIDSITVAEFLAAPRNTWTLEDERKIGFRLFSGSQVEVWEALERMEPDQFAGHIQFIQEGPHWAAEVRTHARFLERLGRVGQDWAELYGEVLLKDEVQAEPSKELQVLLWQAFEKAGDHLLIALLTGDEADFSRYKQQFRLGMVGMTLLLGALQTE